MTTAPEKTAEKTATPAPAAPVVISTLAELTAAVAECAELELALISAAASCKKRVERIKLLYDEETTAHTARREALEAAAIEYVKANKAVLLQGKKSVKVLEHQIKVKPSSFAACDDEKAVIATLEDEAAHGANEKQREAAGACLRRDVVLNKEFVHEHWKEHAAWFESVGLRIETAEKWALKFNFAPGDKPAAAA
jgi:hypothetical protein